MNTYISLLRGINVSGQKKIRMDDLKILYESMGFQNIKTYIQSGNIIFNTSTGLSVKELSALIEKAISMRYKYNVPVIIRTIQDLDAIISGNPFFLNYNLDINRLLVTFLNDTPEDEKMKAIENLDYSPERFIAKGKDVYLYCPLGYGKSKLSNTFFEKKLDTRATTRNWRTVNKLISLTKQ